MHSNYTINEPSMTSIIQQPIMKIKKHKKKVKGKQIQLYIVNSFLFYFFHKSLSRTVLNNIGIQYIDDMVISLVQCQSDPSEYLSNCNNLIS